MPSIAARFPKVNRKEPDCRSAPTSPTVNPTASERIPRILEDPSKVPTVAKAVIIRAKNPAG